MLSGWHPARCQSVSSITWPARQLIETTDCRVNVASPSTRVQERIDPGGCGSWPLILCRRDYMSWLPKISSRSFIQNCCWTTLQVSRHPGRKRLVSKMKGITNFSRCLKQFDGLTWLTLTPIFYGSSACCVVLNPAKNGVRIVCRASPTEYNRSWSFP